MIAGTAAYRVGSDGSVWSRFQHADPNEGGHAVGAKYQLGEWRQLRTSRNRTGYIRAAIYKDGVQQKLMVHRLVLEAFVGPCPAGLNACHNDDDRTNNALDNLRWDTAESNWKDRKRNGRHHPARGEASGKAKLTEADVLNIRSAVATGEWSSAVAIRYGVAHGTVRQIVTRKSWSHV